MTLETSILSKREEASIETVIGISRIPKSILDDLDDVSSDKNAVSEVIEKFVCQLYGIRSIRIDKLTQQH